MIVFSRKHKTEQTVTQSAGNRVLLIVCFPLLVVPTLSVACCVNPQGIPWANLPFGREFYRNQRLTTYRNYTNLLPEDNTQYMVSFVQNVGFVGNQKPQQARKSATTGNRCELAKGQNTQRCRIMLLGNAVSSML